MKALLTDAQRGNENALLKAGEAIQALPRDAEGVFLSWEKETDPYETGDLLYAVYMEYETKYNKKAGYADIALQLTRLYSRLAEGYSLKKAAGFIKLLKEVLAVTSPEIYEHYRTIQDLLKKSVRLVKEKEGLELAFFPELCLKEGGKEADKEFLRMIGKAVAAAWENDQLPWERYGELGVVLQKLA